MDPIIRHIEPLRIAEFLPVFLLHLWRQAYDAGVSGRSE